MVEMNGRVTETNAALEHMLGYPLGDLAGRTLIDIAHPDDAAADAARLYRELYPELGVPRTVLLPGAAEAVAAVRAHGGRAVVVSAQAETLIHAPLEYVGLTRDGVVGDRFGPAKGAAHRLEPVVGVARRLPAIRGRARAQRALAAAQCHLVRQVEAIDLPLTPSRLSALALGDEHPPPAGQPLARSGTEAPGRILRGSGSARVAPPQR